MKKSEKKPHVRSIRDYLILFARIVFSLFLFAIVIISPLLIISTSRSFYQKNINEQCFSMISEKDCRDLQENARLFLKGDAALDSRYTAQEQSHFADVKKIMDFGKSLVFSLLFFIALYFAVLFFFDRKEIFAAMKLSGIMVCVFILLLLISISISFDSTFFLFHAILFPQGNWTFPFDFTIITVFPEQFFVHAAVVSFLMSLGTGLILLGTGHHFRKKDI